MKSLIGGIIVLSHLSVVAGTAYKWDNAPNGLKNKLYYYLVVRSYIDKEEHPLGALDEDYMKSVRLKCANGQYFDYIQVFTGGIEHGPLYEAQSMNLMGENYHGDTYVYGSEGRGILVDCKEI